MVSGSMIDRRTVLAGLAAAVPTASLANDKPVAPKVVRSEVPHRSAAQIVYGSVKIGEVDVAYREAGPQDAPVILLLHGFPTSSHLFRTLIPLLAARYHLIAPDLPGFGNTVAPSRASFGYSFDHLADVMTGFIDGKGIKRLALYVFDYGAPVGFRLALNHPERITAIVTQNGNAYIEGLGDTWKPWQAYWQDPSVANRDICRASLTEGAIREQYFTGAPAGSVGPDGYTLDMAYLDRNERKEVQLDLILSYRTNVALYPEFQAYFRKHQPPLLAVWGKNDPYFTPAGARAFARDLPKAEIHFLDTGHFALETHSLQIAGFMREFLSRHPDLG